jgi:hypothetical protein
VKKPTKSSVPSKMAMSTPRLAPSNVSISQETITHMRQCEAREWIRRYRKKIGEVGSGQGKAWWEQVKVDIEKRRGKAALDSLIKQMNEERREGRV